MTPDNSNDLGKILKQRRLVIPLTLRELATASNVSTSYLGRIEKGKRFPSAHILRKIAKPLGLAEIELLTLAGYLLPQPSTEVESETQQNLMQLDPYVAAMLSQEPVGTQRTVIGILAILKSLTRVDNPAEWPEFREYSRRKYPDLDEDLITMIEDLIERSADKKKVPSPR